MLDEILNDEKFSLLMKMHVYECIEYLLQNNRPFSIMANIDFVNFSPELPEIIKQGFNQPVIIFTLAGYTFESAILSENEIKFKILIQGERYEQTRIFRTWCGAGRDCFCAEFAC